MQQSKGSQLPSQPGAQHSQSIYHSITTQHTSQEQACQRAREQDKEEQERHSSRSAAIASPTPTTGKLTNPTSHLFCIQILTHHEVTYYVQQLQVMCRIASYKSKYPRTG
jgi:hypothetical protein